MNIAKVVVGLVVVPVLALAQQKPAAATPPPAPPAAAPAAPAQPPAPPKPAAELDQLKWMGGNWKCDAKYSMSPMGPAHDAKFTVSFKPTLDNFWYALHFDEKKTKEMPMNQLGDETWGWDPNMKKLVRMGANNMGGTFMASATGMAGDTTVWTGEMSGPMGKMPFTHTLTKKGDKEGTEKFEVNFGQGLVTVRESSCKK